MNRFVTLLAMAFPLAAMPCASGVAVFALLTGCASSVAVGTADNPPPPKTAVADPAFAESASKLMVIQNPDGTFTVQKKPPNGNSQDGKIKSGLEIPPQVVAPIFSSPEN